MIKKILKKVVLWLVEPETKKLTANSIQDLLAKRKYWCFTKGGWKQVEAVITEYPNTSYIILEKEG